MLTPIFLTDLDPFLEPILIHVSIDLKIEPPILDSHIPFLENECELQFFDLDTTLEPKLTLKHKVNFFKLVLVPELSFQRPNHLFHKITFY